MVAHERIPRHAAHAGYGMQRLGPLRRAADGGWRLSETAGQVNKTATNPRLNSSMAQKQTRMPAVPARVQRTKSLDIGVPAGSQVEKAAARPEGLRKPVIVYGTSIIKADVHRGPGMIWTSILGRMLDRPVINLGFSASGDMAPPVGEVLAEIDAAAYVIDCTWNMGRARKCFWIT